MEVMKVNKKWIGHISKVYFNKIVFEVSDPTNLQHNYLGDFYIGNGLNDYVTIYHEINKKYIYQVIGLYEQEKPYLEEDASKFDDKAYFEAIPIGEIESGKFEYGLATFPMIGEDVYLTTIDDIERMLLNKSSELSISLGMLMTHQYLPRIDVEKLFTNHLSILGNTGSGKSTTVRKMLSELINLEHKNIDINKMNFVIFDVHNEYQGLPKDYAQSVSIEDIAIPTYTLSTEDWINLVRPASAVQLPILMNGLRMASLINDSSKHYEWIRAYCALELYNNQQTDAVTKRTKIVGLLEKLNSPDILRVLQSYNAQYSNFQNAAETEFKRVISEYIHCKSGYEYKNCQVELVNLLLSQQNNVGSLQDLLTGIELVILLEESRGNSQVRSHCSTLITRIENLIYSYSNSLFDLKPQKIDKFFEVMRFEFAFTIFDCSSLEDNDLLFYTGYIMREVFEKQKFSRNKKSQISRAYHFILDEAHRYLTENKVEEQSRSLRTFERIAKEGRKFGMFLIVASQRPGELSKTVLSQCNNFILHRIRNNIDIEQMRKSIPYINDMQLFRLSYLRTGTALAVGDAFMIPMEINIEGEKYGYNSASVKLKNIWKVELQDEQTETKEELEDVIQLTII